jgi:hypothetical protein
MIEYDDYLRLLELSRSGPADREDSTLLRRFSDLVAGVVPHLTMGAGEFDETNMPAPSADDANRWNSSILVRHYVSLEKSSCRERLLRLRGGNRDVFYHGEVKDCRSEAHRWYRRTLEYTSAPPGDDRLTVSLGNFRTTYGMGLVYGYHGQVLTKETKRSAGENFLFPRFGGGNGIRISGKKSNWHMDALWDSERNKSFSTTMLAASAAYRRTKATLAMQCGHGHLRNRLLRHMKRFSLISVSGRIESSRAGGCLELAVADHENRVPVSIAFATYWKRSTVKVGLEGWVYHSAHPSYFSGGPSSRRTHTVYFDNLDFAYRDKYAGEKGGTITTSFPCLGDIKIRSAIGYAVRGPADYRTEETFGLRRSIGRGAHLTASYFRRTTGSESAVLHNEKIRMDLSVRGTPVRTRLIVGYSRNDYQDCRGYMAMIVGQINNSTGRLDISVKFDNLNLSRLENRYTYCMLGYAGRIAFGLESCMRYVYRYRRGSDNRDGGTIRVDILWSID